MNGQLCSLVWSNSLRLGSEKVDAQHKHIFQLLKELVDQCVEGSSTEFLKETLDFLLEYTIQHFHDEESLQIQYNFPEYKRHKRLHEDFKTVVGVLAQRFAESGSSQELSRDINRVIVRWLINHIQQEDKKIGDHIRRATARTLIA